VAPKVDIVVDGSNENWGIINVITILRMDIEVWSNGAVENTKQGIRVSLIRITMSPKVNFNHGTHN
jgi:hypothetical protein